MDRLNKIVIAIALVLALCFGALVASGNLPSEYASFPPPGGVETQPTPTPS